MTRPAGIEVTPTMIEAGSDVLWEWIQGEPSPYEPGWVLAQVAARVFEAMEARLETVMIITPSWSPPSGAIEIAPWPHVGTGQILTIQIRG